MNNNQKSPCQFKWEFSPIPNRRKWIEHAALFIHLSKWRWTRFPSYYFVSMLLFFLLTLDGLALCRWDVFCWLPFSVVQRTKNVVVATVVSFSFNCHDEFISIVILHKFIRWLCHLPHVSWHLLSISFIFFDSSVSNFVLLLVDLIKF